MKKWLFISFIILNIVNSAQAVLVQLQNAEILQQRLKDEGFEELVENTEIINDLADQEFEVWEIVRIVNSNLEYYDGLISDPFKSDSVKMMKSTLIEEIIGEHPDAIKELYRDYSLR